MNENRIIDSICDDFEENWTLEQRPKFESYCHRIDESHRKSLLKHLLQIDIELRFKAGDSVRVDDYQSLKI